MSDSATAPRIATRLLKQFGSSPNNDAIIGDLTEQYQQGRSRWWYRKQVAIAIMSGGSGYLIGLMAGAGAGAISIAGNIARNDPIGTVFFPATAPGPLFLAVVGYAAGCWWRKTGLSESSGKRLVRQAALGAPPLWPRYFM